MEGKKNNITIRNLWTAGSEIEIYSKSKNQWFLGKIMNVINDNEGEWLRVKYNCKSMKEVQRLAYDIRPRRDIFSNINKDIDGVNIRKYDNCYAKSYELTGELVGKGTEGLICGTKYKKSELNDNIQIVTKVYEFDLRKGSKDLNKFKINRIKTEYCVFNKLKLIDYRNTLPSFTKAKTINNKKSTNILIVMEKLAYSLYNKCVRDNKFIYKMPSIDLKYFVLEVSGCIHRLHSIGYGHFDINPYNIMYNSNNNKNIYYGNGWKIIDGGSIEKIDFNRGYEEINGYRGKVGYTAPEMIIGKHKITKKADVWSLGVVILFSLHVIKDGFVAEPPSDYFTEEEIKRGDVTVLASKMYEYYRQELLQIDMKEYLLKYYHESRFDIGLYNLLLRMLQFDPLKRPSMLDIINDKYFNDIVRKTSTGIKIKCKTNPNKYKLLVNANTIVATHIHTDNDNVLVDTIRA